MENTVRYRHSQRPVGIYAGHSLLRSMTATSWRRQALGTSSPHVLVTGARDFACAWLSTLYWHLRGLCGDSFREGCDVLHEVVFPPVL